MVTTKQQPTVNPAARDRSSAAARWTAAGAAVVFGLALFVTVAAIDVPHDASDAELLRWWQQSGNRTAGVISGFAAIFAGVAYPVVANYVTGLRSTATSQHWRGFTRSMVAAVTALWLVTGAVRATIGHAVDVTGEPLPGVDTLRIVTGINYALLGLSGMTVLALSMLAFSILLLRTRAMRPWVGRVGLMCSVPMLASVAAQYGALTTLLGVLWSFCLAVAVWLHREDEAQAFD